MTLTEHIDALIAAEATDDMIAADQHIDALIDGAAVTEADFQAKAQLMVKMCGNGDDDQARLARSMVG